MKDDQVLQFEATAEANVLHREIAPRSAEEARLKVELRVKAGELELGRGRTEVLRQERWSLKNSRSWRLTGPLRRAARILFGLARKLRRRKPSRAVQRLETGHLEPGTRALGARMRPASSKRILVIDDQIPYPRLGSGFPRANSMLHEIHAAGWFITFYPLALPRVTWREVYDLLPRDVEVMADLGVDGLRDFLRERVGDYHAVLVSRPHNMEAFRWASGMVPDFLAGTKLIYDVEAISAEREAMRCALAGTPLSDAQLKLNVAHEIGLAADATIVVAVGERDARTIRAESKTRVEVIGHSIAPAPTSAPFDERSDILFVGALVDDQSPNTDSIRWFVREVMPKLDVLIGANYRLKVIGRNGSSEVQALADGRVILLGPVDDLRAHYNSSRIFIAPTRFAAGLPMKVHEAAAAGVPVATTRLIAKQLSWDDGVELLAADEAADFAAACHRLYTDRILWGSLRDAAVNRIATECSPAKFSCRVAAVLAAIQSD